MDQSYNGWTNYATWRVNLEMFDGMSLDDVNACHSDTLNEIAESVEEWCKQWVSDQKMHTLLEGWIYSFLSDVDWKEIARHLKDNSEIK